ncbi:MAG: carbon-nitrogen hydrolase, partial [Eggerthellaceae bacterium]|nr:carbon-nitrogen hydrolase [Eggerthellaceae bacterium]
MKDRTASLALVQLNCSGTHEENLAHAEEAIRDAAGNGAQVICLPELFSYRYFCQERRYEYYDYACETQSDDAVSMGVRLAKELGVVIPVSFYEKDKTRLYNSVACIDADGSICGVYRKTHIPDDHFYQEKFYFSPGDSGFKVFDTNYGRLGIGICWDQWFPEVARALALDGADLIIYPTAIGSEPILGVDSKGHWQRCMQGHAAANLIPVMAVNRTGTEVVRPCAENAGQSSSLDFFGSSFATDITGKIIAEAPSDAECTLYVEYNLTVNE